MPKKVSYWANTGFTGIDTSGVAILGLRRLESRLHRRKRRQKLCGILTGQNGIQRLNGQQMEFRFKEAAKIDRMAYGFGDGAKVYKLAQELYVTPDLKKE